jgi:hypothetical protein
VGARARAEVPEVPSAEVPAAEEAEEAEVPPAEEAQRAEDDVHGPTSDDEAGSDDDETLPAPAATEPTANGAANGHLPVQAPAATVAE